MEQNPSKKYYLLGKQYFSLVNWPDYNSESISLIGLMYADPQHITAHRRSKFPRCNTIKEIIQENLLITQNQLNTSIVSL